MGRIKNIENFGRRSINSQEREPLKMFILSVEGNRTEFDYFSLIEENKQELKINSLLKIKLIERTDSKSSPNWVLNLMEEYINEFGIEKNDKLWIIIDRDKQNNTESNLKSIMVSCEEKEIKVAMTNPCFELWLLLHCIDDITKYDYEVLLENPKKRRKARKRFIDDELTIINGSYNKQKINKKHFIKREKIENAIKLEQKLENDLENILKKLGSNIGALMKEIFENNV